MYLLKIFHMLNGWQRLWLLFCGTFFVFGFELVGLHYFPWVDYLSVCAFLYSFGAAAAWVRVGFKRESR